MAANGACIILGQTLGCRTVGAASIGALHGSGGHGSCTGRVIWIEQVQRAQDHIRDQPQEKQDRADEIERMMWRLRRKRAKALPVYGPLTADEEQEKADELQRILWRHRAQREQWQDCHRRHNVLPTLFQCDGEEA